MTWNTMNIDQRAQHLITEFCQAGMSYREGHICAHVFIKETLLMLPATIENEKQITYWKEVQGLIKQY